ncbi:MAG: tetratricopeptide repeat protein [Bacteroidales bacterium]|jgi:tetratricopeptide (TPR) repeat protein|nr:tetratricopeptide repeat protein [Bacteroidales bacterium]
MNNILLRKNILFGLAICLFVLISNDGFAQNDDKNSKIQLAFRYYGEKQWEKAAPLFLELYEMDPKNQYSRYYLMCEIRLNEFQKAERFIKKVIKDNPVNNLQYEVDLGYLYNRTGDLTKAQKKYDEVIAALGKDSGQAPAVSSAFQSWAEDQYAIKAYLKARDATKNSNAYAMELANLYYRINDFKKMSEEYIIYAVAFPNQLNTIKHRLQTCVANDKDDVLKPVLKQELIRAAQKYPEEVALQDILIWLAMQEKDFSLAYEWTASLERRLNDDGNMMLKLGDVALSNHDFDIAIKAYRHVASKKSGLDMYTTAKIRLLEAYYQSIVGKPNYQMNDLLTIERDYLDIFEEFGKTRRTVLLMKDYAHLLAFYMDRQEDAIAVLHEAIETPQATANQIAVCKMELGDVYVLTDDVWDALLLYSQVDKTFKNNPLGYEAKFKTAKLSFYMGEFEWANAQLKILKAATDRFIANDALELSLVISDNMEADSTYEGLTYYARADLLIAQHKYDEALAALDKIPKFSILHSLNDDVVMKKAEIAMLRFDYHQADSLFEKVATNFPMSILVDNALYRRAKLNEEILRDKETAMECYRQIITEHSGSIYASEARKSLRALRGESSETFSLDNLTPEERLLYETRRQRPD